MKKMFWVLILLCLTGCIAGEVDEHSREFDVDPKDRSTVSATTWTLWNTYYYVSAEPLNDSGPKTTLYSPSCQPIAQVSLAYSDRACIEGTGRLKDGRMVNYASTCRCGRPCPTGGTVCWSVTDPDRFPWGKGARNNALSPMRSIAVDRRNFQLGTTIYIPAWQDVNIPSMDGVVGFVHDGCFRADDVGGAIRGQHIDIFSGPQSLARHFERTIPTRSRLTAHPGGQRCEYLLSGDTPPESVPPVEPQLQWLGTPCHEHSECADASGEQAGYCHRDPRTTNAAGLCTASCEGFCPDRSGSAPTFCVDAKTLGGQSGGLCVAQAAAENAACGNLAGFASILDDRFVGSTSISNVRRSICLPEGSIQANGNSEPQPEPEPTPMNPPAEPSEPSPPRAMVVHEPCGDIDYHGQCHGNVIEWCDGDSLSRIDCTTRGETCGYVNGSVGYFCVSPQPGGNAVDPSDVPDAPNGGNGGLCDDATLPMSDHARPCPGVPENTWRCGCSERYETTISQVCRAGHWTTYATNPNECDRCDGRYTTGCDGD